MKILLLIYIFTYTFCINEIYNITYSQEVEINTFISGKSYIVKPSTCDAGREFYLRLKMKILIILFTLNLNSINQII